MGAVIKLVYCRSGEHSHRGDWMYLFSLRTRKPTHCKAAGARLQQTGDRSWFLREQMPILWLCKFWLKRGKRREAETHRHEYTKARGRENKTANICVKDLGGKKPSGIFAGVIGNCLKLRKESNWPHHLWFWTRLMIVWDHANHTTWPTSQNQAGEIPRSLYS